MFRELLMSFTLPLVEFIGCKVFQLDKLGLLALQKTPRDMRKILKVSTPFSL